MLLLLLFLCSNAHAIVCPNVAVPLPPLLANESDASPFMAFLSGDGGLFGFDDSWSYRFDGPVLSAELTTHDGSCSRSVADSVVTISCKASAFNPWSFNLEVRVQRNADSQVATFNTGDSGVSLFLSTQMQYYYAFRGTITALQIQTRRFSCDVTAGGVGCSSAVLSCSAPALSEWTLNVNAAIGPFVPPPNITDSLVASTMASSSSGGAGDSGHDVNSTTGSTWSLASTALSTGSPATTTATASGSSGAAEPATPCAVNFYRDPLRDNSCQPCGLYSTAIPSASTSTTASSSAALQCQCLSGFLRIAGVGIDPMLDLLSGTTATAPVSGGASFDDSYAWPAVDSTRCYLAVVDSVATQINARWNTRPVSQSYTGQDVHVRVSAFAVDAISSDLPAGASPADSDTSHGRLHRHRRQHHSRGGYVHHSSATPIHDRELSSVAVSNSPVLLQSSPSASYQRALIQQMAKALSIPEWRLRIMSLSVLGISTPTGQGQTPVKSHSPASAGSSPSSLNGLYAQFSMNLMVLPSQIDNPLLDNQPSSSDVAAAFVSQFADAASALRSASVFDTLLDVDLARWSPLYLCSATSPSSSGAPSLDYSFVSSPCGVAASSGNSNNGDGTWSLMTIALLAVLFCLLFVAIAVTFLLFGIKRQQTHLQQRAQQQQELQRQQQRHPTSTEISLDTMNHGQQEQEEEGQPEDAYTRAADAAMVRRQGLKSPSSRRMVSTALGDGDLLTADVLDQVSFSSDGRTMSTSATKSSSPSPPPSVDPELEDLLLEGAAKRNNTKN